MYLRKCTFSHDMRVLYYGSILMCLGPLNPLLADNGFYSKRMLAAPPCPPPPKNISYVSKDC